MSDFNENDKKNIPEDGTSPLPEDDNSQEPKQEPKQESKQEPARDIYGTQFARQDRRPDYSYNWDGKEHGRTKQKKHIGRALAAAVLAIFMLAAMVYGVIAALEDGAVYENSGSSDTSLGAGINSEEASEDHSESVSVPEVIVPDPKPDNDSDGDADNGNLTAIYEQYYNICCTVTVTYGSTASGYSIGSGFVINSENGYIATNYHVIEDARKVTVEFYDGSEYEAEIVGGDSTSDLAVLKIEAEDLAQAYLGDSGSIKVGERVVAIGTPYSEELAGTMTTGIVSGIARDIEITNDYGTVIKTMTLIQTDCSINPGNSGGPLIDMNGRVIGITSLKIADEEFEGIGFAIPITSAIRIFNQIIAGEKVDSDFTSANARLGITVSGVEAGLENYRIRPSCEYPEGALVVSVEPGTAIYKAGLEMFDIITDFNGKAVTTTEELINELAKYKAGESVTVTVFRFNRFFSGGETHTLEFELDSAA